MTKEQRALYDLITTALRYKDESDNKIDFYWDELSADLPEQDLERAFRWFCERGVISAHSIGFEFEAVRTSLDTQNILTTSGLASALALDSPIGR